MSKNNLRATITVFFVIAVMAGAGLGAMTVFHAPLGLVVFIAFIIGVIISIGILFLGAISAMMNMRDG